MFLINRPSTSSCSKSLPNPARAIAALVLASLVSLQSALPLFATENAGAAGAAKSAPGGGVTVSIDSIVRNWLKIPVLKHSNIGVEIMSVPSCKVLYSLNGNRRFTPASTVKAITTACAYDTLGPEFRYRTLVAGQGAIAGEVLHGDLLVVASQDPSISRQDLLKLASSVAGGEKPVKQIDGQVKVVHSPGSDASFHPSWLVEDWGRNWMPVASNFVVDRNITSPTMLPAGYHMLDTHASSGALFNLLLSSPDGPGWAYLERATSSVRVFRPNHPKTPPALALVEANPDEYNLALLSSYLHSRGVKILSGQIENDSDSRVFELAEHYSDKLPVLIRHTLHKSDNLYAQQILRTLGAQSASAEHPSSASPPPSLEDRGLRVVSRWLSKIGVSAQDTVLLDGCGLCRKNGVTPHALNQVIAHMAGPDVDGEFLSLMKARDESSEGRGVYRYKTGSMDTVRAIAGLLTTSGGQHMAVTIMINGHTPSVRNLRIAIYDLINHLRVIKRLAPSTPAEAGGDGDPNVTKTADQKVIIEHPASRYVKVKPAKRPTRGKKRKHN